MSLVSVMTHFYAASSDPANVAEHNVSYGTALRNLQVLSVSGADAIAFLHRQLTQDVQGLTQTAASFAGYCTAKGRLLATLLIWVAQETATTQANADRPRLHALVRNDMATSLMHKLNKFVLRAHVKFALAPYAITGVWTPTGAADAITALETAVGGILPHQPWQRVELPCGTWIAAPTATQQSRWWWIASAAQLEATPLALRQGQASTWDAADLAAGLPWVGSATQELFMPQAVNLDLVGGINFTKGCYPGQEVVARSHYRGKVKRRMAYGVIADWEGTPVALGTDVFTLDHPQPCGRVVDAVCAEDAMMILFESSLSAMIPNFSERLDTSHDALNVARHDAANPSSENTLRLGSVTGPLIQLYPLPYSLGE